MLVGLMARDSTIVASVPRSPTFVESFLSKFCGKHEDPMECSSAAVRRKNSMLSLRASRILLCASLLMALLVDSARALDPHRLISQYAHTVWRVQDGFPRSPITITQTSDGYIWIAAGTGLLRFDGVRMTPDPSQNSFPTNTGINALVGTRDGSLWMGTYIGLYRLKDGTWFKFPSHDAGVQNIIADHADTVWITQYQAHEKGSLCQVSGNELRCYDESGGSAVDALAEDSLGNIWFGCLMLCRWNRASMSYFMQGQMNHPTDYGVVGLATGSDGSVWVAMDGTGPGAGVGYLRDGQFISYVAPGFDGTKVRATALLMDSQQTLWIATGSEGLYHIHDGRADHYAAAQGLSGDVVASMFEDREGNLWIATDGGVDLFRDVPIVSFSSSEGLHDNAGVVLARKDRSVWIGSGGSLAVIQGGSMSFVTEADGHPIQDVDALLEDQAGQVWLGIDRTVMTYQAGKFSTIKGLDGRPLENMGDILSFAEDIEGNIWAVAEGSPARAHHLLRIRDHRLQEDTQITARVPQSHFLAADPAGGIWIGALDGKLFHYVRGVTKAVSAGRSSDVPVKMGSFSIDPTGVIWAATSIGLYRWEHGALSVLDSHNGLPCSRLFAAIQDASGSMWLSGKCGYVRISAADVVNWSAHPDSQVRATLLGPLDGADPGYFSKRIQPGSVRSQDGRLWFIGFSTVQMIDPGHSYKNAIPPPVHVEGLIADRKNYPLSSPITLPPLTRDLEIDYTALSFVLPQRMAFRYMLEGRDKDWQDPGLRRQALYNDLRPGNYRFRVIASNNDGVWNTTGASLQFQLAPAWYQTNLFRWAAAVAALLLLAAIYRVRVRQIGRAMTARFDERLAERTRIARDLHDTFLQTIQGSKLVADDALDTATDYSRMRQAMKTLSEWLSRATLEGRASLNSLRTSATEVTDLAEALRRAIEECRIQSSMEVALNVVGEVQPMHPVVRDEVYRIGYEAIRNACVHSNAKQLWVNLSYLKDLTLSVRDNGTGMDVALAEKGKVGHFGLLGMRERSARIAAKLTIKSSASEGTVIELIVPGGVIYSHPDSRRRKLRGIVRSLMEKLGFVSRQQ
jgi:signal transduction histidine kinase/ligand-binding sensor domain-containing protein